MIDADPYDALFDLDAEARQAARARGERFYRAFPGEPWHCTKCGVRITPDVGACEGEDCEDDDG